MLALRAELGVPVEPVETVGWNGDALEAQCFGFLAVRVARGLPLSFPGTTGVPAPTGGGRIVQPIAASGGARVRGNLDIFLIVTRRDRVYGCRRARSWREH